MYTYLNAIDFGMGMNPIESTLSQSFEDISKLLLRLSKSNQLSNLLSSFGKMEALLIDGLDRKGPLTDRKLWKRILRHYDLDEKQETEELVKTRKDFDYALRSLLDSHKIMVTGGSYSINKVAVTKRQRVEESQAAAQVSKKIRLNEEGDAADGSEIKSQQWSYTELWKNGERHWREGTFDPEYLRTNPDGLVSLFFVYFFYKSLF